MFEIKYTDELIVNETGLSIVGKILDDTSLRININDKAKITNNTNTLPTYDVVASYIGCLAQAKPEFARVDEYRNDAFFKEAMKVEKLVPSEEITRQRMDAIGAEEIESFLKITHETNKELLKRQEVKFTPRILNYVPVDIDVSPHDNSGTKKEGVSYTYKGFEGYSPIYAYIGQEGYLLREELRGGSEHSQCAKTIPFFKEVIKEARELADNQQILITLDSGHSCNDNVELFENENVDYIIKKNNGKCSLEDIFEDIKRVADKEDLEKYGINSIIRKETRDGKEYYIVDATCVKCIVNKNGERETKKVRIVKECIKRTIDKTGQVLLIPEYEIKQYYTSLEGTITSEQIIELYHAHATCEQFHSEIKTDMDLERLPSGKFNTNQIVLSLAVLTFNILRMIGQANVELQVDGLKIKRKRLKTVIKDIICLASKIVTHARKKYICISNYEIFKDTFTNIYNRFCCERLR